MCSRDTDICVCNDLSAGEIADFIKDKNIQTLDELYENDELAMGDKCGSCKDNGYDDDGLTIELVFNMTKKNEL